MIANFAILIKKRQSKSMHFYFVDWVSSLDLFRCINVLSMNEIHVWQIEKKTIYIYICIYKTNKDYSISEASIYSYFLIFYHHFLSFVCLFYAFPQRRWYFIQVLIFFWCMRKHFMKIKLSAVICKHETRDLGN